jgi:hypothetical protein
MKQIIVMIAMIMLGITIAGFVGDFGDSAKSISENANKQVIRVTPSGTI